MGSYVLTRVVQMLPVMVVVSMIVFVVMHLLPGDPILAMTGLGSDGVAPAVIERMRQQLGSNDPIYVQYT